MLHFVVQRFFLVLPLISRFLPTYSATEDNNTIKIWEFKDTSLYSLVDEPTSHDLSKCSSIVNETMNGVIYAIEGERCVNLYQEETDCHGPFVRFFGRSGMQIWDLHTYKWSQEGVLTKDRLRAASIGPCFNKCDSRNLEGNTGAPIVVSLYLSEDHEGNATTLHITGDDCYLIPSHMPYVSSIQISGDESSCIELHDEASCSADFTQLRPWYPQLNRLEDWFSKGRFRINSPYNAKALARCGSHCGRTIPGINPANPVQPGKNVVTVYPEMGYYGHGINANLSNGCANVERPFLSIRTYGTCVTVYATPNCSEARFSFRTNGESVDYYKTRLSALTTLRRRSMKLCDDEQEVEIEEESVSNQGCESVLFDCTHFSLACFITSLIFGMVGVLLTVLWERVN
ncbi:uncharacterized protein LOC110854629 isoform X1 [Folsomia candida]|uniref:uncharacterized protein LOC110854629 isoform X1 n=2 Tax=Folsomia candida TaxID=158441 RepID=UPI00160525F3|nr:uncharacterized protein LOC110854629 isoform X1 [Folsomia candida]